MEEEDMTETKPPKDDGNVGEFVTLDQCQTTTKNGFMSKEFRRRNTNILNK